MPCRDLRKKRSFPSSLGSRSRIPACLHAPANSSCEPVDEPKSAHIERFPAHERGPAPPRLTGRKLKPGWSFRPMNIGKPRRGGAFRQRACKPDPVASGHLSRRGRSPDGAPKRTCDLPGPRRAGSTVLLGLAPGGVCLAAVSPRRRCALTAPFHLYLYAAHVWPRHRPYVSVALSRGFRRVGVTHRPALWCPDFPRSGCFSAPRPLGSHHRC